LKKSLNNTQNHWGLPIPSKRRGSNLPFGETKRGAGKGIQRWSKSENLPKLISLKLSGNKAEDNP